MKLSKNFTLEELIHSDTAEKYNIKNIPTAEIQNHISDTVQYLLQPLRDYLKMPLTVTSGYRCPELNHLVGGVKTSAHQYGYAVDILPPKDFDFNTFCKCVNTWLRTTKTPFDQCIIEKSGKTQWLHLGYKNAQGRQRYQLLKITK